MLVRAAGLGKAETAAALRSRKRGSWGARHADIGRPRVGWADGQTTVC